MPKVCKEINIENLDNDIKHLAAELNEFVSSFTLGVSWEDYQNEINELENITKPYISMNLLNESGKNNFQVLMK